MKIGFSHRVTAMMMVLIMLFTMTPANVLAEATHDHDAEVASVIEVAALSVSASASADFVYAGEEGVTVTAKIAGGLAPYEVTLQAVKDGSVVSTQSTVTEGTSAKLSFAPTSYGDYELVVTVHDAAHTQDLTSVSLAVAEHDTENEAAWAASVSGASVSGNWGKSLLSVAKTQLGYAESEKDFVLKSGAKQGYSRYGAWYGTPYAAWNISFLAFAAEYANIPNDALLSGSSYRSWVNGMSNKGAYMTSGYTPVAGDIAFLSGSRVAVVESVSGANVTVIEGDVNGTVARKTYAISKVAGFGNTGLMQGLYNGTATAVPTAAPDATKAPEATDKPAATALPTAAPVATPVPEEEELTFEATPTPGPGVNTAPKDDNDPLSGMMGTMGDLVGELDAAATAIPAQFSEAYYLMQAEMRALMEKYLGTANPTKAEIEAFVAGLELQELYYIGLELEELGAYAVRLGVSEYELLALVEAEEMLVTLSDLVIKTQQDYLTVRGETYTTNKQASLYYSVGSATSTENSISFTYTCTFGGFITGSQSYTFRVYNRSGVKATLSFDFSKSGFDNRFSLSGSSYSGVLKNGEYVEFTAKSQGWSGNSQTDKLTITNITLTPVADSATVNLYSSPYGAVQYEYVNAETKETIKETLPAGDNVSVELENVACAQGVKLTPVANEGYQFMTWVSHDAVDVPMALVNNVIVPEKDETVNVMPRFNQAGMAWFGVGTTTSHTTEINNNDLGVVVSSVATDFKYQKVNVNYVFDTFARAVDYASANNQKYIVLMNSGALSAGEYTIPAGVTLLIPFDAENTLYTTSPVPVATYTTPNEYRTLTLQQGAKLIVNGALSLSAQNKWANSGAHAGSAPTGNVSFVRMASGSNITVNSGGVLYAYGFVTGSGTVNVSSGGTVYEFFQVADFRGGTQTSDMQNGVFPMQQYYVQNVEVPMTLYAGAKEYSYTTLYMGSVAIGEAVAFIGDTKSMFTLNSGNVTKKYDGTKDRLIITANGDMAITPIELNVGSTAIQGMGFSLDSAQYVLPINNNMTVNVVGGSISMNQDVALTPGAIIKIAEGVTCNVVQYEGKAVNLFAYSSNTWGPYSYGGSGGNLPIIPVAYAPSKGYNRTTADLVDAQIEIGGTIIANTGYVYETGDGASITGKEGARVFLSVGSQTVTYMIEQNAENTGYVEIPLAAPKLKNTDGTYCDTAEYGSGVYAYFNDHWHLIHNGDINAPLVHTVAKDNEEEPTCMKGVQCQFCPEDAIEKKPHWPALDTFCGTQTCTYDCGTVLTGTKEHAIPTDANFCDGYTCANNCGTTFEGQGHSYDEGQITTPATCSAEGLMTYTCTRAKADGTPCGATKTETIVDADAHDWGEWTTVTSPTCTEGGLNQRVCNNDGTHIQTATVDKLGHDWDKRITDYGGCLDDGLLTFTCENEGCQYKTTPIEVTAEDCKNGTINVVVQSEVSDTDIEAIIAPGHTEVTVDAVAATCTEKGSTAGVKCSECKTWIEEPTTIDALGHNYAEDPNQSKQATCQVTGTRVFVCGNDNCLDQTITITVETTRASIYDLDEDIKAVLGVDYDPATALAKVPCSDFEVSGETPATCTEAGVLTKKCKVCEKETTEVIPALKHSYEREWPEGTTDITKVETTPATCTAKGETKYTCGTCKAAYKTEPIPALGHTYERSWPEGTDDPTDVVVTPPTCTSAGVITKTCTCGETATFAGEAATGHNYTTEAEYYTYVAPTCEVGGSFTFKCKNGCGEDIVINENTSDADLAEYRKITTIDAAIIAKYPDGMTPSVDLKATGHNQDTIIPAVAPTCEDTGLTEGRECSVCGEVRVAQTEVAATGHTWPITWTVTLYATCAAAGSQTRECTKCDEVETEEIAKLEHKYTLTDSAVPTCTQPGYKTYTCTNLDQNTGASCGDSYTDSEPALGHSYINGGDPTYATCLEDGHIAFTCARDCGYVEYVYHTTDVTAEDLHQDIKNWLTENIDVKTLEKKPHSYGTPVLKERTCTEDGYLTLTCTVCKEKATEENEGIVVVYYNTTLTNAAAQEVLTAYLNDNPNFKQEDLQAVGHNEVVDKAVAATCDATGMTEGKHCDVCGHVILAQETVDKLPHNYKVEKATDPTCTEEGTLRATCDQGCNYTQTFTPAQFNAEGGVADMPDEVKPKVTEELLSKVEVLDHLWAEDGGEGWVITQQPTCTEVGIKERTCIRDCCQENKVTETDSVPATGHNYAQEGEPKAKTCTEHGAIIFVCGNDGCNETTVVVTYPEDGDCVAQFNGLDVDIRTALVNPDAIKALQKTEHSYKFTSRVYAGCEKPGSITYTCENPHCAETEKVVVVDCPKDVTDYQARLESYHSTIQANLTATDIESLKAWEHDYQGVEKKPSCGVQGYTEYTCSKCKDHYIDGDSYKDALKHNYQAEVQASESCTENGTITVKCTTAGGCGWNSGAFGPDEYESIVWQDEDAKNAVTSDMLEDTTGDHVFDKDANGNPTQFGMTPPTCTESGKLVFTCTKCGTQEVVTYLTDYNGLHDTIKSHQYFSESAIQSLKPLGHKFNAGVTTPATCAQEGSILYTCAKGCTYSLKPSTYETDKAEGNVPAELETSIDTTLLDGLKQKAHVYEIGLTLDPTCVDEGKLTVACKTAEECKQTWVFSRTDSAAVLANMPAKAAELVTEAELKKTDATGHNYDWTDGEAKGTVTTESTCQAEGYITKTCNQCESGEGHVVIVKYDANSTDENILALAIKPHNFKDNVETVVATCAAEGSMTFTCTNGCGTTYVIKPSTYEELPAVAQALVTAAELQALELQDHNYSWVDEENGTMGTEKFDPTCEAPGYIVKTCNQCADTVTGHRITIDYVEGDESDANMALAPLGHKYTSEVTTLPTCTEEGVRTYTCQNDNGHTYTEAVAAQGHAYGTPVKVERNCTVDGTITFTCTVCSAEAAEPDRVVVINHNTDISTLNAKAQAAFAANYSDFNLADLKAPGHNYDAVVTAPTCTAQGYTTHTCQNEHADGKCTDSYVDTYTDPTGHDFDYEGGLITKVEVSCTADGELLLDCKDCDDTFLVTVNTPKENLTDAMKVVLGSDYDPATALAKWNHAGATNYPAETPKCTGYLSAGTYCERCKTWLVERETLVGDHVYNTNQNATGSVYTDPTCTEDGYWTYKCFWCDETTVEVVADSKTNHNGKVHHAQQDATCTADGYTEGYFCQACADRTGNGWIEGHTVIPATGHTFTADRHEPSCEVEGYIVYTCKKGCTYTLKPSTYAADKAAGEVPAEVAEQVNDELMNSLAALAHNWSEETTAATCTKDSFTVKKCLTVGGCGYDVTTPHPETKLGHVWSAWTDDPANTATCTKAGKEIRSCQSENCDGINAVETRDKNALGHDWSEWTEDPDHKATCTETGTEVRTCQSVNCDGIDATETRVKAELGHKWLGAQRTEPTCVTEGESIGNVCERCGTETEHEILPALGHNYMDGTKWVEERCTEYVKPTCTEAGYKVYTCTREGCTETTQGHVSEQVPVAKLGHEWTSVTTDPDCENNGQIAYSCVRGCAYTLTVDYDAAQVPEGIEVNETLIDSIKALNHKNATTDAGTVPTCTEVGYTAGKFCPDCNEYIDGHTEVEANGHAWTAKTTKPTCTAPGFITYTCTVDGCDGEYIIYHNTDLETVELPKKLTVTPAEVAALAQLPHEIKSQYTDPTCFEDGYTEYWCPVTGEGACNYRKTITDTGSKRQHHMVATETVVAADCVTKTDGYTLYECDQPGCDHTAPDDFVLWDSDVVHVYNVTAADCDTPRYCTKCQTADNPTNPALGHDKTGAAATCLQPQVCARPGCNEVLVEALGHEYLEAEKNATCIDRECQRCHETIKGDSQHSFEDADATCVDRKCTLCGNTIAGDGQHSFEDADATCIDRKCALCELTYEATTGHDYEDDDATCIDRTCLLCGAEAKATTDHDYDVVIVDSTCVTKGTKTETCKLCGDVVTTTLELKTEHTYSDAEDAWVVTDDPTCQKTGSKYRECTVDGCNAKDTVKIPVVSCVYNETYTAATCGEDGFTTYTCKWCGNTYTEKNENDKATGEHQYEEEIVRDSTCAELGEKKFTCSVCGASYTADIAKKDHTYTSEVTQAPTCTEAGVRTYTCVCNDSYTESIAATGHNYKQTGSTPKNCTEHGILTFTCQNGKCGDVVTVTYSQDYANVYTGLDEDIQILLGSESAITNLEATGHAYEQTASKPKSCTEHGVLTFTCQNDRCGDVVLVTYSDDLFNAFNSLDEDIRTILQNAWAILELKGGHDYTTTTIAPTCTEDGYTLYECKNCDYSYNDNYKTKLDHSYTSEVLQPSTCKVPGVEKYICTRNGCGDSYEKELPLSTVHKYVTKPDVKPTCTEPGSQGGQECSVCGQVSKEKPPMPVNPTGHNYSCVYTAPACTTDGTFVFTCQNGTCGDKQEITVSTTAEELAELMKEDEIAAAVKQYSGADFDPAKDLLALGHDIIIDEAKAPTCTEDGLKAGQHCSRCDAETVEQEIDPKLGHAFSANEDGKDCLDGRICTRCNQSVAATAEHKWNDGEVTTDPTCTAEGEKTFTCTVCGGTYTESVKKAEHSYNAVVTAPTCLADGFTTYTCTVCGDTYTDNIVETTGHAWGEPVVVPNTCGKDGYTSKTCSACGEVETYDETLATGNHTYGDWTVSLEPTCEVEGEKQRTCTVCGNVETETVEAKGHLDDIILPAVEPDCFNNGKTEGTKCSACGSITVAQKNRPKLDHVGYTTVFEAKDPTCTEDGNYRGGSWCTKCNTTLVEPAKRDKLGHDIVIDAYKAPTCTETGLTEGQHCSRCTAETVEQEVIDALGHEFAAVRTEPTCTADGYIVYTCVRGCTYTLKPATYEADKAAGKIPAGIEVDDALITGLKLNGHTEEEIPAVAPTCTAAGKTAGVKCSVCGTTLVAQRTEPATGHVNLTVLPAKAPTCTETGLSEGQKCACGTIVVPQTQIDKLGHDIVADPGYAATCTEAGLTDGEHCTRCDGATVKQVVIAAKGHTEVPGTAKAPTCTEPGHTAGSTCSVCGNVVVAQEVIGALNHVEVVDEAKAPTCTETGLKEGKHCSRCGEKLVPQEVIDATGHTEKEIPAVDVTCTTDGKTAGVECSVCGKILTPQITIAHKGHVKVADPYKAPTCTETGLEAGEHCSVCNEVLIEQKVIPALEHDYEGTVTVEPTCTEDGEKTFVCKNDATHTYTETVTALGHDAVKHEAQKVTCTEIGWEAYETCTRCDHNTYVEIPASGHDMDEGAVTKQFTCTEAGEIVYACQNEDCDYEVVEEIKAHHVTEVIPAVDPTCTEPGREEGSKCTVCGEIQEGKVIPASHKWETVTIITQVTCTTDGKEDVRCTVEGCGATDTIVVPATGHTEVIVPAVPETCDKDGLTEGKYCAVCEKTLVEQEVVPAAHKWNAAPCTTPGATCTVCNKVNEGLLEHDRTEATCSAASTCKYCGRTWGSALPHTEVDDDEIPPQCEETGLSAGKHCAVCGHVIVEQEVIPALGHDLVEHKAKNPTFTSGGWYDYWSCTRCSHTESEQEDYLRPALGEQSIDNYDELIKYLPYLEQWAVEYSKKTPGTDPVDLVIKYVRTGVDRYNSGSWGIMAGYEDAGFAKFVAEKEDEINSQYTEEEYDKMIQVSGLKDIKNFTLPNGNAKADIGHMFGTMDITYNNKGSVNHADVGGWAGDLVDLLSTADHTDHTDVIAAANGDFETLVKQIKEKLLGHGFDHGDVFSQSDIWGDLDAFYVMQNLDANNYEAGDMTALFQSYFTTSLSDVDRAGFLLEKRLNGVSTRAAVREAVYTAYTSNTVISTLENTREFNNGKDVLDEMRIACCYAFADYLCELAGDYIETTVSDCMVVFESSYSNLAPGITMETHKAKSTADNEQMVYYLAYGDVTRSDVDVIASYESRYPETWGMARVLDQANAIQELYSNPANKELYPDANAREAARFQENFKVIAGINGSGFNMATGEPGGLLVMHGYEYQPVNGNGFFGMHKDGYPVIGTTEEWNTTYRGQIDEAIAGFGSMLVQDGKLCITATGNYWDGRASRTAIGITRTGKVVFMVLDGRQSPWSCGGSMAEIAEIMLNAGCVEAINLDGGGSTTFIARQPGSETLSVANKPSDGVQRSVSTALMMTSTAPSSTKFDHALIEADYAFMTVGAQVQMRAKGLSATGNVVDLPAGVRWEIAEKDIGIAEISEDGILTSLETGAVDVQLMLGETVVGSKTMTVVVPDQLYFTKEKVDAVYGSTVALPLKARYDGKEVAFSAEDIVFTLSTDEAGKVEDLNFVAAEASSKTTVTITAELAENEDVNASIQVILYKQGENSFDFDKATGGDRLLAWQRTVSNSYTTDNSTYYIVDPNEDMVTSYVLALDMTQIPIPKRLDDLIYMLPGADMEGACAWTFLLQLAERISDQTEVKPTVKIDPNFDVDYSEIKLVNEYFKLTKTEFDEETSTLTLTLNWIKQSQPIPADSANPLCMVTGLKLTPKDDAAWDEKNQLKPVLKGEVSYRIYMRASGLYSFCQKPENQETFGLYPYVHPNIPTEKGGYFEDTYTQFSDTYTLVRALKNGWYNEEGGFRYYVNGEYLTGIQQADGLFYDFGTNGVNVGKKTYTGKLVIDGDHYYIRLGEIYLEGWVLLDDIWHFYNTKTGVGAQGTMYSGFYDIEYEFTDAKLKSGKWYHDGVGWQYYYGPYCHGKGWKYIDGQEYFFDEYYAQTGVCPIQQAMSFVKYWYEFTDTGVKVGIADSGFYPWQGKLYYVENYGTHSLADKEGLYKVGDYYYYARFDSYETLCNQKVWVAETNGLLDENGEPFEVGYYRFDENGRMIIFTGLIEENGLLYYYHNGLLEYNAGVIEFEGNLYNVGTDGSCWMSKTDYVWKPNGLVPEGYYRFDENGHMIMTTDVVNENGEYWYYDEGCHVDWNKQDVGIVKIGEGDDVAYYYIDKEWNAVVDTKFDVPSDKTNGLVKAGTYRFGADGKADMDTELNPEDGKLVYYENGCFTKDAGLVVIGGDYYYVKADGTAVVDTEYNVTKTNKLPLPAGTYRFDENGKIILTTALVEEDGELCYYVNGKLSKDFGLLFYEGDYYYINAEGVAEAGKKVDVVKTNGYELPAGIYRFGTDAKAILTTELANEDGTLYYYENGRLAVGKGLIKVENDYYFIDNDGKAVTSTTMVVEKTNGYFPANETYEFDADGKMVIYQGIVNGYYYVDGVKTEAGLVKVDGDYYYAGKGGKIVTGQMYDVTVTNDKLPAGTYDFDEEGKIVMHEGLVDKDGTLYYFEDGKLFKDKGLIKVGDDYYHIGEKGFAETNIKRRVDNTNGLRDIGVYRFDEEGKMIQKTELVKEGNDNVYYIDGMLAKNEGMILYEGAYYHIGENGIAATSTKVDVKKTNDLVPAGIYRFGDDSKGLMETEVAWEEDLLIYYENGKWTPDAGLVKIGDDYYFIGADAVAAVSTKMLVEQTNDYFPVGTYEFGADGKMVVYRGIVNGYYYVEGVRTEAGLIKIGDDYYYAAEGGKIIVNRKYDVVKHNDLLPGGTYRFNAEGKLILETAIVKEGSKYAYYENGLFTKDAGLVNVNGAYYYINENGYAVADTEMEVTEDKTNGKLPAGTYRFDEEGKAILTTELVDEDGEKRYYVNGVLAKDAGLIEYEGAYYYINAEGVAEAGKKVDVVKTNDLLPEGLYRFDEEGKAILTTEVADENGTLYYYDEGRLAVDAGLVKVADDYYYIDENGAAATDSKVDVVKTNDLLPEGLYRFDEAGKANLATELVEEDGKLYYYDEGRLAVDEGLVKVADDYYYIDENGAAVTDTMMLVEKTNDLLPEDTYCFGADGKMFERLAGDANADGVVEFADALLVLEYSSGADVEINFLNANVDGNETVDLADALLLMQLSAGWDVELI